MNSRRYARRTPPPFPVFALYGIILLILAAPVFAQTGPAENAWGLDYEGKSIVAVLPFEGEEDMALRFLRGTLDAVGALEKYSPREVRLSVLESAGLEIPTDMPPNRDLAAGARYALTGGVYPGTSPGEYYLQLWLWDMSGSTMIYTDDLRYVDIDDAMQSLPGLVEWLFSHIHEVPIESAEVYVWPDPFFSLGLRAGVSPRWYVDPDERSPRARALSIEGGITGALRLTSLLALQAEIIITHDTLVYRGGIVERDDGDYRLVNKKFSSLSLMVPLLLKANFKPGIFRLSPLAGIYAAIPLGRARYRYTEGEDQKYSYSYSIPLGFILGFEAATQSGPGILVLGLRYAMDIGAASIDDGEDTDYRRQMFSLSLGYEFGFLDRNSRRGEEK
jgi:hypothetical protein